MGLFGKSKAEKEAEERAKAAANKPYIPYLNECPGCRRKEWNLGVFKCDTCGTQFCAYCKLEEDRGHNSSRCPYGNLRFNPCKGKGVLTGIVQWRIPGED